MVILTIATDKSLRNRPQLLLFLNLAIFDLIKGLEVLFFTVSSGFYRDYIHPPVGCIMAGFVHIQWQAASCICMIGIGYFRYEVVCNRNFSKFILYILILKKRAAHSQPMYNNCKKLPHYWQYQVMFLLAYLLPHALFQVEFLHWKVSIQIIFTCRKILQI